jgi:hypothetical protein
VAVVRLVLGLAFVVSATLRGLDGGPAATAALGGALVLVVIVLGRRGGRTGAAGFDEALPVPPSAGFDPGWLGVLLACIPSTAGVSAMAGIALVVSPALAAVLGGVLIALGVLAAVYWLQLADRQRREGTRYWIERGPRPRLFTVPSGDRSSAGTSSAQATEPERTD